MIAEKINKIIGQLPEGVTLVAVSKFHPVEQVLDAYHAGQRDFGESRAQELVAKAPLVPDDAKWHFIGHLQKNKVRQVVPFVTMIQSVDSIALLRLIEAEAQRIGKHIDVLLELHIAQEASKSGFTADEILTLAQEQSFADSDYTRIRGLMTMATFTDDAAQVEHEFAIAGDIFNQLKSLLIPKCPHFDTLSMGMSDDWHLAVRHGSTMVRIGTDIFGQRQY